MAKDTDTQNKNVQTDETGESMEKDPSLEEENTEGLKSVESEKPIDEKLVLEKALTKSKEDLLYLTAEFENFKKRTQKEKQQSIIFANEKFIQELLPIVENFDLALQHSEKLSFEEKSEEANFVTGVRMTHQSLTKMLAQFGVSFTGEVGEPFDPTKHEALSIEEKEGVEPNTVIQVFQKGCSLHDRLLKPAKVVVSKPQES